MGVKGSKRRTYRVVVDYCDYDYFEELDKVDEDIRIYDEEFSRRKEMGKDWPGMMRVVVIVAHDYEGRWDGWYGLNEDRYLNGFKFDDEFEKLVLSVDREVVKGVVNKFVKKVFTEYGQYCAGVVQGERVSEEESERQQVEGVGM